MPFESKKPKTATKENPKGPNRFGQAWFGAAAQQGQNQSLILPSPWFITKTKPVSPTRKSQPMTCASGLRIAEELLKRGDISAWMQSTAETSCGLGTVLRRIFPVILTTLLGIGATSLVNDFKHAFTPPSAQHAAAPKTPDFQKFADLLKRKDLTPDEQYLKGKEVIDGWVKQKIESGADIAQISGTLSYVYAALTGIVYKDGNEHSLSSEQIETVQNWLNYIKQLKAKYPEPPPPPLQPNMTRVP